MDNQCGPTEQHRELRSVFHGGLDGRGVWGRMDQVCVWLSPFIVHLKLSQSCLLIYYTAIQNKKFKKLRFSDVPLMKIAEGLPVARSLLTVGHVQTSHYSSPSQKLGCCYEGVQPCSPPHYV